MARLNNKKANTKNNVKPIIEIRFEGTKSQRNNIYCPSTNVRIHTKTPEAQEATRNFMGRLTDSHHFIATFDCGLSGFTYDWYPNIPYKKISVLVCEMKARFGKDSVVVYDGNIRSIRKRPERKKLPQFEQTVEADKKAS